MVEQVAAPVVMAMEATEVEMEEPIVEQQEEEPAAQEPVAQSGAAGGQAAEPRPASSGLLGSVAHVIQSILHPGARSSNGGGRPFLLYMSCFQPMAFLSLYAGARPTASTLACCATGSGAGAEAGPTESEKAASKGLPAQSTESGLLSAPLNMDTAELEPEQPAGEVPEEPAQEKAEPPSKRRGRPPSKATTAKRPRIMEAEAPVSAEPAVAAVSSDAAGEPPEPGMVHPFFCKCTFCKQFQVAYAK